MRGGDVIPIQNQSERLLVNMRLSPIAFETIQKIRRKERRPEVATYLEKIVVTTGITNSSIVINSIENWTTRKYVSEALDNFVALVACLQTFNDKGIFGPPEQRGYEYIISMLPFYKTKVSNKVQRVLEAKLVNNERSADISISMKMDMANIRTIVRNFLEIEQRVFGAIALIHQNNTKGDINERT